MGKVLITGLLQNRYSEMFVFDIQKFNGRAVALRLEPNNKYDANAVACYPGVNLIGKVIIEQSKDVCYLIKNFGFKKQMVIGNCFIPDRDLIKSFKKPIIGVNVDFDERLKNK